MTNRNNHPEKCPITGAPFFMDIMDENGEIVPTYGGPFDSYTIPEKIDGEENEYVRDRFCHDSGQWMGSECIIIE